MWFGNEIHKKKNKGWKYKKKETQKKWGGRIEEKARGGTVKERKELQKGERGVEAQEKRDKKGRYRLCSK